MLVNRTNKKISWLLWAVFTVSPSSLAQPLGAGQVNMRGAIFDAACSIDLGDDDQSIYLGDMWNAVRNRESVSIPIEIRLSDCVLKRDYPTAVNWRKFKVTFDGLSDGALFGFEGDTSGKAFEIKDSFGRMIVPGQALSSGAMLQGEMGLNYAMKLFSDGQPSSLKMADTLSILKIKLDYF